MTKLYAKELMDFFWKNVREIRSKPTFIQKRMMRKYERCSLRPSSIPIEILDKMTLKELEEYKEAAGEYRTEPRINEAYLWLKEWLEK